MYKYVSIEKLSFHINIWEGRENLTIWSNNISEFFAISHINDLIPILRELEEKYPENFVPNKIWDEKKNKVYVAFYVLDKEGCEILCKNIKTKPSLKKRFLNIIKGS